MGTFTNYIDYQKEKLRCDCCGVYKKNETWRENIPLGRFCSDCFYKSNDKVRNESFYKTVASLK